MASPVHAVVEKVPAWAVVANEGKEMPEQAERAGGEVFHGMEVRLRWNTWPRVPPTLTLRQRRTEGQAQHRGRGAEIK